MAKLEIKLTGLEIRAEGEAAFAALRSLTRGVQAAARTVVDNLGAEAEGREEDDEEDFEDEGETEESFEDFEGGEEQPEGEEGDLPDEVEEESNASKVLQVLRSEARKAGAGPGDYFYPPSFGKMAARAEIELNQFRNAFAHLKTSGRVVSDPNCTSSPRRICIAEYGGEE